MIEKIAFPAFAGNGNTAQPPLVYKIKELLSSDTAYNEAINYSQELARKSLSFEAVASQLGEWKILEPSP